MAGITGRLGALGAVSCIASLAFGCGKSGEITPLAPYISIDLDGGERTEHADVPADLLTNDQWKTTHMVFRLIPAGTFQMGDQSDDPEIGNANEIPVHTVTITKPFYMGVFPVTQAQWAFIERENPSSFLSGGAHCPVETVTWYEVTDFITSAFTSMLDELAFRLPTEAEWEYACKAGTSTNYSYGDTADGAYMWYSANSDSQTQEVGTKLPNPWGLYDMHGNVWEWVHDWYGAYTSEAKADPQGPTTGTTRVLRGASFSNDAGDCRSALRGHAVPENKYNSTGFRVVVTVAGP